MESEIVGFFNNLIIHNMGIKKEVVTIGMFDGVHAGHKEVLKTAVNYAHESGVRSTAITFDHIPKNSYGAITTLEEKIALIRKSGIDNVKILPFEKIKNIPPEIFCRKYLKNNAVVILGYNFRFGKGRSGDTDTVKNYSAVVVVIKPVKYKNRVVSSTLIKKLLISGDIKNANKYLNRNYGFSGIAVKGFGIGRKLGYPTINMRVPFGKILPEGIFASFTSVNGRKYKSATYIGKKPTFGTGITTVETHIISRRKIPGGSNLFVELLLKIRNDRKFASLPGLAKQIEKDISACKKYFSGIDR